MIDTDQAFHAAFNFIKSYYPDNDGDRITYVLSGMERNKEGRAADPNTLYTWIESIANKHNVSAELYVEKNSSKELKTSMKEWFEVLIPYVEYFNDPKNSSQLQPIIDDLKSVDLSDEKYIENEIWVKWEKCFE